MRLSGFVEFFTFSTPAPMVSVLADIALCKVIINMTYCATVYDVILVQKICHA